MRRIAAVIALVVLVGACGGDKKDVKTAKSDASTTSSTIAGDTTTTEAAGGASATTVKGSSPTSVKGSVTTTKGASSNGAPAPAAKGTYDYKQSGTSSVGSIPANGTLVVDAPNASGVQVWHQYVDPSGPPSDTTIAFRSDGPFITDTVQRTAITITCHFDQPVPAPPFPPTDGKPIKGHANCGEITADVSGSITGHRTTQLDGVTIDVIVATVTITTHGQIESTMKQTEWWAPSLRLTVHSERTTDGKYGTFPFHSNITTDLKSGKPR